VHSAEHAERRGRRVVRSEREHRHRPAPAGRLDLAGDTPVRLRRQAVEPSGDLVEGGCLLCHRAVILPAQTDRMMRYDTRLDAPTSLRSVRIAWPALVLALAYGAFEWLALARARGADRLASIWRSVTPR